MKTKLFVTGIIFSALLGCGAAGSSSLKEAWNAQNAPIQLSGDYVVGLQQLPASGTTQIQPWSDTYWPTYRGGIAQRWRDGEDGFTYTTPTLAELQAMTPAVLSALSPAEKFDIFIGRLDYALVAYERQRTNPQAPGWEGICHGWAPAAINFAEPKSVMLTSVNGVQIPFGASDVKALLSYYQGVMSNATFRMLGERCNVDISNLSPAEIPQECRDTNAGAFHVVLANQLGIKKQAFVADVTRDQEVWNQPVHSFSTQVQSENSPSVGAAAGTVRELTMLTRMEYTVEVSPQWSALVGTSGNHSSTRIYNYRIELDARDNVIGGAWLSDSEDRPDFLWTRETPAFSGYFERLSEIFAASVASPGIADPRIN